MQITHIAKKLEHYGLKEKEAKVYVASLFLGSSPAQKIAEQAGINRATAYVILEQLIELGLISQTIEGNKTVFTAEDPKAIELLLERQIRSIDSKKSDLKSLLPELNDINRTAKVNAPVVKFYKGADGIFNAYDYALRKSRPGSEILGVSNYDEARKHFTGRVFKSKPKRLNKKITYKFLYSSKSDLYPSKKDLLRETFHIEKPIKADITIYENFVVLVTYEKNQPIGIMIENTDIATVLAQLFNMIWDKRTTK